MGVEPKSEIMPRPWRRLSNEHVGGESRVLVVTKIEKTWYDYQELFKSIDPVRQPIVWLSNKFHMIAAPFRANFINKNYFTLSPLFDNGYCSSKACHLSITTPL